VSENEQKWYNQGLASEVIGGVILLAIAGGIAWAASEKLPGWVVVIAALVGLLVLSLFLSPLRTRVWGWVGMIRERRRNRVVTTIQAQESARKESEKKGYAFAVEESTPLAEALARDLREVTAERDALQKDFASLEEAFKRKGQGLAAAEPRPLPLPKPRWTVYESQDEPGTYILRNAVPRSIAREVHIEGDEDFDVTDAGHWEELSGTSSGSFDGEMTHVGQISGVYFKITWFDEYGLPKDYDYWLRGTDNSPPPRRNMVI